MEVFTVYGGPLYGVYGGFLYMEVLYMEVSFIWRFFTAYLNYH